MKALVTRPLQDAASLAAALSARGIEPLVEPLLTIRPVADAARRLPPLLRGAQAVLFTSVNGVRAFAAATELRELPAFAVGDATAAAARAAGFPLVMSAGGNVADLARLVIDRLQPRDGALVHAAAREVAGDLAGSLNAAGFSLRRAVLYEAVAATRLSAATAAALAERSVAFALFFSPRTAASFVRLVAAAGLAEACRGIVALALSEAVAAVLGALAWREIRVAEAPNAAALVAALDFDLADRARPGPPSAKQEAPA
jgi:uroporphyrinogen-III synthase